MGMLPVERAYWDIKMGLTPGYLTMEEQIQLKYYPPRIEKCEYRTEWNSCKIKIHINDKEKTSSCDWNNPPNCPTKLFAYKLEFD